MPPRPCHEKDGALEDVAARSHAASAFKSRWAWGLRMAGRFETRAAGRRRRPARRPSYPRVPSRGTLLPAQVEMATRLAASAALCSCLLKPARVTRAASGSAAIFRLTTKPKTRFLKPGMGFAKYYSTERG